MATVEIRCLQSADAELVLSARDAVFDNVPIEDQVHRLLASADHVFVAALTGAQIIGMATGVVILQPDKPATFYLDEVGVDEGWRRQGIGESLCRAAFAAGRSLGCHTHWLATEHDNTAARALFAKLGGRAQTGIVCYDWS